MIHASAPGKILWIGGYSVLEKPNISLVTAVNSRVHAYVEKGNDAKIIIEMPQFGIKKSLDELNEHEKKAAKFVISAINAANAYAQHKGKSLTGFEIKTLSDPAFSSNAGKSGLGSSAAVTVATVSGLLALYGISDKEIVHKLSQYAHAFAQGKVGSGFDIASAAYGTIKYSRYSPSLVDVADAGGIAKAAESEWDCQIEKVNWPANFRIVVGNFIGESASTTEMVKKVHKFKEKHPAEYAALMADLDAANSKAISSISQPAEFKKYFDEGRLLTKKLGELCGAEIEPQKSTFLIEKLLKNGAFVAKLPGAGGGDSVCAICLDEKSETNARNLLQQTPNIQVLNLKVENEGYRVETVPETQNPKPEIMSSTNRRQVFRNNVSETLKRLF